MLKADGLSYREIGRRLDISYGRANQLVLQQGKWLAKAMRRTKVTIT
jgi:DNA-directed RNA polymerase specialized sigma24 family protein